MQAYLEKTKYVFLVSKTLPEFSQGLPSPSCGAFEPSSTWHDFHFLNYDTADSEEKQSMFQLGSVTTAVNCQSSGDVMYQHHYSFPDGQ